MTNIENTSGPPDESHHDVIARNRLLNTSLVILTVIAVTASLYLARAFFAPLVLGILISYAWWPVVSFMHRCHVPRAIGAGVVIMLLVSGGWFAGVALQAQAIELIDKVPAALKQFNAKESVDVIGDVPVIDRLREAAAEIEKVAESAGTDEGRVAATAQPSGDNLILVEEPVRVVVDRGGTPFMDYVLDGSLGVLVILGQTLTILLFVYFVLASGNLYQQKLVRITGESLSEKKVTSSILDDINNQLRRFFFVMLVGVVFVGLLTWAALWWLDVEEAMLWGAIAGVASIIPYVGPVFVMATLGFTSFLQFGSIADATVVALASLAITSVQGSLLTPWMTSRASSMNAVAVFVSLLFWGWLWGPIGLVVATPIQMIIKSVCDHVDALNPVGEFLGG